MEHQSTAICGYSSCSDRHHKEGCHALSVHSVVANFCLSAKQKKWDLSVPGTLGDV